MANVQYISSDNNEHFTPGKTYKTFITSDGLTLIDDRGEEHAIATKKNTGGEYSSDTFFRNNFEWVEESEDTETNPPSDPEWSIDCPHCGHKHKDWQNYIDTDDMSGEFDETCENCGEPYQAKYDTVITILTKKVDDPEFRQAPTADELFETWKKDLGYHKAMLIACGYDISYVVALTETDAEAEIEAISE